MVNLMNVLATLSGLALVSISSLALTARGWFKGAVSNILTFFIITYATIVLLAQLLSELYLIRPAGFLIGHLIIVLLVLPWNLTLCKSAALAILTAAAEKMRRFRALARSNPLLAGLGLLIGISMLLGAYLILVVPPNTYDSLSYHLSRVAHWLHNGTMHHFDTPDPIKIVHQGYNFEIGLLWLTVLWGNDRLAGFVQWTVTIGMVVAIYGLARQLKFPRTAGIFAALIWSTFTIVVLQATSTKNDTLVAFFVVAAFYFLIVGLRDTERTYSPSLILFGLSLGLGLGTKSIVLMFLPGFAVGCTVLLLTNRSRYFPKLVYAAVWSLLGIGLVGFYNYALNLINYHFFFGSPELFNDVQTVQNPSLATFETNLARIIYHFFDPGGLPDVIVDYVQQWRPHLGEKLFEVLHIAPNLPNANMNTFQFDGVRQVTPREDAAWYGPLGFLLFLPTLLFYLFVSPFLEKDVWKWVTALVAVSYLIVFAILTRWQMHMGRLVLISVSLIAPLLAGFYTWSEKYKPLRWSVVAIGVVVLGWSSTHNYHKSILGPHNIWHADYYTLRTVQNPKLAMAHRYLDSQIPEETRLGVAGEDIIMRWDYLFFGPNLKRDVVYLGSEVDSINGDTFAQYNIDYLVLGLYPPHTGASTGPLWPVIEEGGLQWFLIKRSEAELFDSRPTQPDVYREVFGDDYLAYLEFEAVLDHEPQPVHVLTTDPKMPYYDGDKRFVFGLPSALGDLAGFSHLIVAPWWTPEDYERLDLSLDEARFFLTQEDFVEKVAEANGYALYRMRFK
jgi:hypothetical protein